MTRHVRLLLIAMFVAASLLVGALGDVAGAVRSEEPTTPSETAPADDAGDGSGEEDPPTEPVPDPPVAKADSVIVVRGTSVTVKPLANDFCGSLVNATPCQAGDLTEPLAITQPSGWTLNYDGATGYLSITVPATAAVGTQTLSYTITDAKGTSAPATLTVQVFPAAPDRFNPPAGTLFTHPFRKAYRNRIYNQIIRTINSVPAGGQIRIASWSFSSKAYYTALNNARKRGVSVQIVLSARNTAKVSDYRTLAQLFGTNRAANSWVYKCSYSCRGAQKGSTMHSKIFLFSRAAGTSYITMTGSANLTKFAVSSQWNSMNTVTRNAAVYTQALSVFNQMRADRPAAYVEQHADPYWMYYYPRGAVTRSNDFMLAALRGVRCTGAVGAAPGGRTQIRIAMYAWYQTRGQWLAERVRTLWNQGCDIRIVYGIMGNPVKSLLYSPKGRGRIPMRQILLTNRNGDPIYYIHDKYVAINGHYGNQPNASFALQGSFNFSNLGFGSDENMQRLIGRNHYNQFRDDFNLLWKDKQARAPSPTSNIKNVERTARVEPRLGTGHYTYMEAD